MALYAKSSYICNNVTKYPLVKLSTIRSVLAGICMVLFAFGITPKLTLHNLVATHKDSRVKNVQAAHSDTQLSKAGFNCQCDNLIIESPFVSAHTVIAVSPVIVFATYQKAFVETVFSTIVYHSPLRGPPAC